MFRKQTNNFQNSLQTHKVIIEGFLKNKTFKNYIKILKEKIPFWLKKKLGFLSHHLVPETIRAKVFLFQNQQWN